MIRYLVIADRTLGGSEVRQRVVAALARGPVAVKVLVPVHGDVTGSTERLEAAVVGLRALGADTEGRIVDADPVDAVMAHLARSPVDEILLCTLPVGVSRWLEADVVQRVRATTEVPVTHIVAPSGLPGMITASATRLTIYIGESDRHGRHPLYQEIVRRARAAGLSGATVLHGVEGFGASSMLHTARLLSVSEDLPVVIVIVDSPERIEPFLRELDEVVNEGLVTRDEVEVVKYAGRRPDA